MFNLTKNPRTEKEIFADLVSLCTEEGFAHAVAFICRRDNVVGMGEQLSGDDLAKHKSAQEILIRTEISILIGCMCKRQISWNQPSSEKLQQMITRASTLLSEVHSRLIENAYAQFKASPNMPTDPTSSGEALREAVLYSSESAYTFQYRDMATQRYLADSEWLLKNKGYDPKVAQKTLKAICDIQSERLMECLKGIIDKHPDEWTFLPGFTLDVPRLAAEAGVSENQVNAFLDVFSYPSDFTNETYNHVDDFNQANAAPLLKHEDGSFVLFQYHSLAEATYDTPFYWFSEDDEYFPTATKNRGEFAEKFLVERLISIFGEDAVYPNVDVYRGKQCVGEMDCLVVFGEYALQFQAKSQRLTLPSRKGNIGQIEADFQRGVQNAYNQAKTCALAFGKNNTRFQDSDGNIIEIPDICHVYPICVVSDHYPALPTQTRHFLKYSTNGNLEPPLVCDVFLIDVITEMLPSPLRFLSYICMRAKAGEKVLVSNELTTFAYFLQKSLWLEDELDILHLDDSVSVHLDAAMAVRRDSLPGNDTPEGILTKLNNTSIGRVVSAIEHNPNIVSVGVGLRLLELSEDSVRNFSPILTRMIRNSERTGEEHDLSIPFEHMKSGLTIHINSSPSSQAEVQLRTHMKFRKYAEQADSWHGIVLSPETGDIRFGALLKARHRYDPQLEEITAGAPKPKKITEAKILTGRRRKTKVNDPCPCGSGKKYKKCGCGLAPRR